MATNFYMSVTSSSSHMGMRGMRMYSCGLDFLRKNSRTLAHLSAFLAPHFTPSSFKPSCQLWSWHHLYISLYISNYLLAHRYTKRQLEQHPWTASPYTIASTCPWMQFPPLDLVFTTWENVISLIRKLYCCRNVLSPWLTDTSKHGVRGL